MPTANICMTRLIELDTVLAGQYALATAGQRTAINRCRSAIETTLHEFIRQDLQRRTGDIGSLTSALNGAAKTLRELSMSVKQAADVLKTIATIVSAAQAVMAIL